MKIYAALSLSMPLRKCQLFAALHFTETQREGYFTNTRAYKERLLNSLKGEVKVYNVCSCVMMDCHEMSNLWNIGSYIL